jgi:hypothetical protein
MLSQGVTWRTYCVFIGYVYVIHCAQNLQVSTFLFGDGFAISGGDAWRVRRRAVSPSLHRWASYVVYMYMHHFGALCHVVLSLQGAAGVLTDQIARHVC